MLDEGRSTLHNAIKKNKNNLQPEMIASNRNSEQKHEPVASEEAEGTQCTLPNELREDEVVNPRCRVERVDVIRFQIRQDQNLKPPTTTTKNHNN